MTYPRDFDETLEPEKLGIGTWLSLAPLKTGVLSYHVEEVLGFRKNTLKLILFI